MPPIGLAAVGYSLWTWGRAGFTIDATGIRGAHDSERDIVPWDLVEGLRWQRVTEPYRVNGEPVVNTVLVAVLRDGGVHRITTRDASLDERSTVHELLLDAQRQGLVPVALDQVDPSSGWIDGAPQADGVAGHPPPPAPTPAPPLDGPVEAEHHWPTVFGDPDDDASGAADVTPEPDDAASAPEGPATAADGTDDPAADEPPPPVWPD